MKTTKFCSFTGCAIFSLILLLVVGCHSIDEPIFGGTVTDVDGNIYHTVTIENQTWMIENLQTTRFNDSTAIPMVSDSAAWATLITPGYCWYNNSDTLPKAKSYGALYNWYAVNTSKLAPKGWHIPSNKEWTTLQANVSKYYYISGSLSKILAAKTDWKTTTSNLSVGNDLSKNNSSGFAALPAGYRDSTTAHFKMINNQAVWWCTDVNTAKTARYISMVYNLTTIERAYKPYQCGFSVRCVKDSI